MNDDLITPNIVISKCIEHEHCRFNQNIISSDVVKKLFGFVNFIPVCPEVEIGLGIPRNPTRLVSSNDSIRLFQPLTNNDFTDKMISFSEDYLSKLSNIDGFILKNRSPSCGIGDVKVYSEKGVPNFPKSSGIFGQCVQKMFSDVPIEDEGRLNNAAIRERFFIKIFMFARFRQIRESQNINQLIEFQAQNKYLLMTFNPAQLKQLGQIVASYKGNIEPILTEYEEVLHSLFIKASSTGKNINALEHVFGYISKHLNPAEKAYFKELIEDYVTDKITLTTVLSVLKSWIIRYDDKYILNQSIWDPFPRELMKLTDSGKSRNY